MSNTPYKDQDLIKNLSVTKSKIIALVIPPSPDHRRITRQIDCCHESKADYLWQPYDFIIMSSLAADEDRVILIDGTADRLDDETFFRRVRALKSTASIFIFAVGSAAWSSDYNYLKQVNTIVETTPLFVIGDLLLEDFYAKLILKDCEGIIYKPHYANFEDMAAFRRGSDTILDGICTNENSVGVSGSKSKLSHATIGIPRHEVFRRKNYRFPFAKHFEYAIVTATWGCRFTCSYCTDGNISPIARNHKEILDELTYINALGIKELFFSDKVFGDPIKDRLLLLDGMKRFNFSWTAYFHPALYKPELLNAMHSAGCHTIITGIDSADLASLKQYNRTVTESMVSNLLNHANRLGMNICADFILGLEHEDQFAAERTIEFALALPIDFASFNIAAPLPGSSIREQAVKNGELTVGEEDYDTLGRGRVLGNQHLSMGALLKLRNSAVRRFYLRPSYIWRRLKRTTSFEHFRVQYSQMRALLVKAL